jgi:tetratricopeptide (TPR) repeat protein
MFRGIAYAIKEEYDLAIKDFNNVFTIAPNNEVLHFLYYARGNLYSEKGEYDLAIEDFSKAIRTCPDCSEYYCSRGEAYSSKTQYDLAIKDFNEAIKHSHKNKLNHHLFELDFVFQSYIVEDVFNLLFELGE